MKERVRNCLYLPAPSLQTRFGRTGQLRKYSRRALLATAVLSASFLVAIQSGLAEIKPLWRPLGKGLAYAEIDGEDRSSIILVRVNLRDNRLRVVSAPQFGMLHSDVQLLTQRVNGRVGINANFFDEDGHALGLVIDEGKKLGSLQSGGALLTGIFLVDEGVPQIIHRSQWKGLYPVRLPQVAIQAGPRLITERKLVKVRDEDVASRRSGVAILRIKDSQGGNDGGNDSYELVLFATRYRFPGATMGQIQKLLLSIGAEQVLNFDGGGSSQLYIARGPGLEESLHVSGGDQVPVALVVVPH